MGVRSPLQSQRIQAAQVNENVVFSAVDATFRGALPASLIVWCFCVLARATASFSCWVPSWAPAFQKWLADIAGTTLVRARQFVPV
jgi:hypothetical protein